jgi:hypothetical protein
MSVLSNAFQNMLNARERVVGTREKVNLNGVDRDALVEIITFDEMVIAGGTAEGGGYRAQIAATIPLPDQYSPCIVRGETLQVLSVEDINAVSFTLVVGDPIGK